MSINRILWGTPYRPWWTYLGRDRRWRKALTAALAATLLIEAGCATTQTCAEMTVDQCDQLNRDLKKTQSAPPPAVAYDFGAGKRPTWEGQQ